MEFFTSMKLSASEISSSQRLKNAEGTVGLRAEINKLAKNLDCVGTILATAANSPQNNLISQPLIDKLVSINNNVKYTLQTVKSRYITGEGSGNDSVAAKVSPHNGLEKRVAVDNLKLKALISTLNFKTATHLGIFAARDNLYDVRRSENVQRYIDIELQLRSRKQEQVEGSLQHKWGSLHEPSYLVHISGSFRNLEWSLSQRLHASAQHLNAASQPAWDPPTRWLHCMACLCHLQAAKSSADYEPISDSSNSELEELGFTVQNYITELEIELLAVLALQPTTLFNSLEIMQYASSEFTYFTGRDEDPAGNSRPIFPEDKKDEGEIMKASLNYSRKQILLRINPDGSITIEPTDEGERLRIGSLSERDLRLYFLKPLYAGQQQDSKDWHFIIDTDPLALRNTLEEKTPSPTQSTLSFQSSYEAYKFHQSATGYRVSGDYGPGIEIRAHKRRFGSRFGKTALISGRLQFWERKPHEQTNMPATRIVEHFFKSANSQNNENNVPIVLEEPDPPFVVLLVQFSNDPSVREGDVFAVGVSTKARVDKRKCDCLTNGQCSRCILYGTGRAFLTLKHGVKPRFESNYAWIEIKFKDSTYREKFEVKLDRLKKLHHIRLAHAVDIENMVLRENVYTRTFKDG